MKYAIISDIHGNLPAFEAVLEDAKNKQVDSYILLGDYAVCLPWGNEVVDLIRGLESTYIIKGNQEDYLIKADKQDKEQWNRQQYKPLCYAYNSLTPDNRTFLFNLPNELEIIDNDVVINVIHRTEIFNRPKKIALFHSYSYRLLYDENPDIVNHYNDLACEAILTCPEALNEIESLAEGVYLFAHSHLQFEMEYKGRHFINPGSVSIPLDGNNTLSYSILEISDSGINIENQRLEYDYKAVIKKLYESDYYQLAPFWCQLIKKEMETGLEYIVPFLIHLEKMNEGYGEPGQPASDEVWHMAVKAWQGV